MPAILRIALFLSFTAASLASNTIADSFRNQSHGMPAYVPGISGSIEILRVGTTGKFLHVSDMIEIVNASNPAATQTGAHSFVVCLPANAKLDSVLAAGPAKIATMISALPVSGRPGHYAVDFPLRPGTTKFAFNYDLPYDGHAVFQTWHAFPLQQMAVMIPRSMSFSSASVDFLVLRTDARNYQVQAVGPVVAGNGPTFTVSGAGDFPSLQVQDNATASSQSPVLSNSAVAASDRAFHASSRPRSLTLGTSLWPTPLWMVASCALLASLAVVAWRAHRVRANAVRRHEIRYAVPRRQPTTLVENLKNELFQLETNRIRGSISVQEYESARLALEQVVERALSGGGYDSRRD